MKDDMKKWMPYKSIVEQDSFLNKVLKEKEKIEKPIISDDVKEEINRIFVNYHNETLLIKYYEDGYIEEKITTLYKIDAVYKVLYFTRTEHIKFDQILHVSYR